MLHSNFFGQLSYAAAVFRWTKPTTILDGVVALVYKKFELQKFLFVVP
ncbi:MAG: hypothetical protein LBF43_01685 [Puniceicoccales bacterium]|nr:hypothetical protein [Puniceicoccales bacterium]